MSRGSSPAKEPRICIVSLKYAPGLLKEMIALGESFWRSGIKVKYLLSRKYEDHIHQYSTPVGDLNYVSGAWPEILMYAVGKGGVFLETLMGSTCTFFYNTHPMNLIVAILQKKRVPRGSTVYFLHEPFYPNKSALVLKARVFKYAVEFIHFTTLKYIDHVILPSEYARTLFQSRYSWFPGTTHMAPLLLRSNFQGGDKPRRSFSFVGRMRLNEGDNDFFTLVSYASKAQFPFRFSLVTSTIVSSALSRLGPRELKILNVINKSSIDDEEIMKEISNSYAVLRFKKTGAQSGVVPLSFMQGTPVIARDTPSFRQHIKHGYNGCLVREGPAMMGGFVEAMEWVQRNLAAFSDNARKSYMSTWDVSNFTRYYDWLVERILE